jgi:hypothetical protein
MATQHQGTGHFECRKRARRRSVPNSFTHVLDTWESRRRPLVALPDIGSQPPRYFKTHLHQWEGFETK